ncbi:hypothetical protein AOLI_G00033280 [Acnodon oligacanthus]
MEVSENIYVNSGKKFNSSNRDNSCEDIYVNEDNVKTYRSKNTTEKPVINTAQSRCSTVIAACLGLTGVLLLAAIIVLSLKFIEERHRLFRVGDQVRVKASVSTPKYEWGRASHKSVGVVTALDGENMTVAFPEQKSWKAAVSEMELAP